MCYAKPRPRCSGHAKEALTRAKAAHASNPTNATSTALREAERDFAITPEGIKQVRAAASKAIDDGNYKRSALLSQDADNRESLRELLSESVKGVREPSPTDYIPYVVAAHHDPEFAYDYFEKDASTAVRVALAHDEDTPTEVLERLSQDRNYCVRTELRENLAVGAEVREALTKEHDLYDSMRPTFGWRHDPHLTEEERQEILKRFATDEDDSAREYAARQTQSLSLLRKLSEDPDRDVRAAAAHNPRMPSAQLERMAEANHKHYEVLFGVASHPNASTKLLESLSSHPDESIRARVVDNDRTPVSVLNRLASDESDYVRSRAAANERTSGEALTALVWNTERGTFALNQAIANPSLPASTLTQLAVDPATMVDVRSNPSTPASVAHIISEEFSGKSLAATDDKTLMGLLEGTQKVDSDAMSGWNKNIFIEAQTGIQSEVMNRSHLVSRLLDVPDDESTARLMRDHATQLKSMLGWR